MDWKFEDYQIEIIKNPEYYPKDVNYSAKFTNGPQTTLGSTPEEAIERLRIFFDEYKKNKRLPIPGTGQHFQVPSDKKFEKYAGIAANFFEFIGEDPYTQIDDQFTISDFDIGNGMIEKIKLEYRIDIEQGDFLVDIFERIKKVSA
jgi:predicted RNase H-like HicB family nuclease